MGNTAVLDQPASTEVLIFYIPEVKASDPMRAAAERYCAELGIGCTNIDIWANPEAIVTHEILVGPTIVLRADGQEIGRLAGVRSGRQVERFFAKAMNVPSPDGVRAFRIPKILQLLSASLVLLASCGVNGPDASAASTIQHAVASSETFSHAILGSGDTTWRASDAPMLDSQFSPIDPGSHRFVTAGREFSLDIQVGYWLTQNRLGVTVFTDPGPSGPIGRNVTIVAPGRLANASLPSLSQDDSGAEPVQNIEAWLDDLVDGVAVGDRVDTTLGGRPAVQFDVHLADDDNREEAWRVDFVITRDGERVSFEQGHDYRVWWIDRGDIAVIVGASSAGHPFLHQAEALLDTLVFGP